MSPLGSPVSFSFMSQAIGAPGSPLSKFAVCPAVTHDVLHTLMQGKPSVARRARPRAASQCLGLHSRSPRRAQDFFVFTPRSYLLLPLRLPLLLSKGTRQTTPGAAHMRALRPYTSPCALARFSFATQDAQTGGALETTPRSKRLTTVPCTEVAFPDQLCSVASLGPQAHTEPFASGERPAPFALSFLPGT